MTNFENSEDIQTLRGLYKRAILYGKNQEMVYDWYHFEQSFGNPSSIEKARTYLVKNNLIKNCFKIPKYGKAPKVEIEPEIN